MYNLFNYTLIYNKSRKFNCHIQNVEKYFINLKYSIIIAPINESNISKTNKLILMLRIT